MAIPHHQFPLSETKGLTRADVDWLRGIAIDYGEDDFANLEGRADGEFASEVVFDVAEARRYVAIMEKLYALDLPPY